MWAAGALLAGRLLYEDFSSKSVTLFFYVLYLLVISILLIQLHSFFLFSLFLKLFISGILLLVTYFTNFYTKMAWADIVFLCFIFILLPIEHFLLLLLLSSLIGILYTSIKKDKKVPFLGILTLVTILYIATLVF